MTNLKFGKYAIIEPITYNFEKEPKWYWRLKPPTARDELILQKYLQIRTRKTPDGTEERLPATSMEVVFEQLALTFDGTNIPAYKMVDGEWQESDEPILQRDADDDEIKCVLGEMPADLVLELWKALGDHIPYWGPMSENPKE